MAIKVTGLFQNPQTNLIYQDPLLKLTPMLLYPGVINMEVSISTTNTAGGGLLYYNIDKTKLQYSGSSPYDSLIYGLEGYVMNDIKNANELNKKATFERVPL